MGSPMSSLCAIPSALIASVWLSRIRHFLDDTVQPYLRAWRKILPMFGPLDLSPMVGVIALLAGQQILISVIDGFRP